MNRGTQVHAAVVSNGSRRPVSNVACKIGGWSDTGSIFQNAPRESEFAVLTGRMTDPAPSVTREPETPVEAGGTEPKMLPGEKYLFVFEINSHRALLLTPVVAVRFTDDAGLHWQIDRDQHLEQVIDRDDW